MPDDSDENGLTDADRYHTAREYVAKVLFILPARNNRRIGLARESLLIAGIEIDAAELDEVAKVMPE